MQGTNQRVVAAIALVAMLGTAYAQEPVGAPAAPAAAVPTSPASGPLSQAKVAAPNLAALQGNLQTIDTLIKAENELALAKARKERALAGLEAAPLRAKAKTRPTVVVNVESIAGLPGNLRVYLTANGQRYENVGVGAKVQGCQIEAIQKRCVVLKPLTQGRKAPMCPTSCWTGIQQQPLVVTGLPGLGMPGQQPATSLPGGPLPVLTGGAVAPQAMPAQINSAAK